MPTAKLTVRLPEATWIGALSRRVPDARPRVLAAMPDGDAGHGVLEVRADDVRAVVAAMVDADGVTDVEPLRTADGEALVGFATTQPLLLTAARAAGVAPEPPIEIRAGRATFEVTATRDRLSDLDEHLHEVGADPELRAVYTAGESNPLLTGTQRDLLATALEAGYYDTPRTCTLTELAERAGVAKSTASEVLHRAEGHVVRAFLDGEDERGSEDGERNGDANGNATPTTGSRRGGE